MPAETVPPSLFHTGRAQCPDCGAALALVDHLPLVHCSYCGCVAAVERRLRTIEPVISEGFLTADYAATRGALEYACCALWDVNTMIERNYAGRMRLAEIVLYRLLYLGGPVQAWTIELAKGQLGLGCRFPLPTLLRFIDDCDAELGPAAIKWIADLINDDPAPRPCVEALLRANGENLPEDIRRAYVRKFPDSPLLKPLPVRYQSQDKPKPTPFDEQIAAWTQLWRTSIGQAVDRHHERQRVARAYWEEIKR